MKHLVFHIIPTVVLLLNAHPSNGQSSVNLLEDINEKLQLSINEQNHPKRELRAAWVTTFTNLDWPSKRGLSSAVQQQEFRTLVDNFKRAQMNAVIVQVRASSDAFYKSKLSPWSEWLTGVQGAPPIPYYDPLEFMLKTCKDNNLEFHAWFNPLRAISHDRFSSVCKDHITDKKPDWFFHYGESYYYNPGIPAVRQYIVDVILEVVKNYDIDGVHLDDYFYPYTIGKAKIPDEATFKKYNRGIQNIQDWRRSNINLLIQDIAKAIKKEKAYVKFGISPLAIWRNKKQDPLGSESNSGQTSYDNLYCDTKLWVKEGWMDYVAPQLYWSTTNLYANYNNLLKWWNLQTQEKVHLYIGHGLYKLDPKNRHSFSVDELTKQVKLHRSNSKAQGSIYFRAKTFKENQQNFQRKFRTGIYQYPAVVPTMPWIDSIPPAAPYNLDLTPAFGAVQLNWRFLKSKNELDKIKYFAIYRFDGVVDVNQNQLTATQLISISTSPSYTDFSINKGSTYTYVVTSFDRLHNESKKFISGKITVKK